jgi:hypothetical protein
MFNDGKDRAGKEETESGRGTYTEGKRDVLMFLNSPWNLNGTVWPSKN